MKNYIKKFLLNPHYQGGELIAHISGPHENLGTLGLLAEINEAGVHAKKIDKLLIQQAEAHYFSSIAHDAEKALEDALQKINFSLSETIKQTEKTWLFKSHVVIASIHGEEVHFAKIGNVSAFLLSQNEIIPITDDSASEDINPVKIFSNIYSGSLPDNSALIFVTHAVLDYISQEKIRKICIKNSTTQALHVLHGLLKKAPHTKTFGVLLIKRAEDDTQEIVSEESPEITEETAEVAETTTEPKLVPLDTKLVEPAPPKQMPKKEESSARATQNQPMKQPVAQQLKELGYEETDKEIQTKKTDKKSPAMLQPPPPRKRMALKLFVALLLLSLVGFAWYKFFLQSPATESPPENPIPTEDPTYQIALNTIQAKFIEAQNLLILDNRKAAETLLTETQLLVDQLPQDTAEHTAGRQSLKRKIATQLLLAQGVNLILPELMVEFSDFTPQEIILKEDALYTYDPAQVSIYRVKKDTTTIEKLPITAESIGTIQKIIDHSGNGIVFYDSLDELLELNLEKNTLKSMEWTRTWKATPIASDIYQGKLYAITDTFLLRRYANSLTGFTQEAEWFKEPQTLGETVDMSIDSAIWILKGNGQILKFYRGIPEEFTYTITPPLTHPTKLFTDLDLEFLYLLEPDTKRLVILKKDGTVQTQFTAEEFIAPKDIAVDESTRTVYILDETRLFKMKF